MKEGNLSLLSLTNNMFRERLSVEMLEKKGEAYISELKHALASFKESQNEEDKQAVEKILNELGVQIMQKIENNPNVKPTYATWDKDSMRFALGLGAASAGSRLFINTGFDNVYKLIFPDVNMYKFNNGKTYGSVFKEIFEDNAVNQGSDEKPYFVIDLLDEIK